MKLRTFCQSWNLTVIPDTHTAFLNEYVECLRPIAVALDFLQGENVMMGDLIPTILETHYLLNQLLQKNNVHCRDIIEYVMGRLRFRFEHIFEWQLHKSQSAIFVLATVTTPSLKLSWIGDVEKMNTAKQWLLDEVKSQAESSEVPNVVQPVAGAKRKYQFMAGRQNTERQSECQSAADLQVVQYLSDADDELSALKNFPLVEKVFLKFNAALPSSAPVDRLFSHAALTLTAKRNQLGDDRFEVLTLLNANKNK